MASQNLPEFRCSTCEKTLPLSDAQPLSRKSGDRAKGDPLNDCKPCFLKRAMKKTGKRKQDLLEDEQDECTSVSPLSLAQFSKRLCGSAADAAASFNSAVLLPLSIGDPKTRALEIAKAVEASTSHHYT